MAEQQGKALPGQDPGPVVQPGEREIQRRREIVRAGPVPLPADPGGLVRPSQLRDHPYLACPHGDRLTREQPLRDAGQCPASAAGG
jgi:hypothetical protein